MQFSNFVTMFALVMAATAVPVEDTDKVLASRHDGDYHDYACCNPAGNGCRLGTDCPRPFDIYCCPPHALEGLEHPFKIEEAPGCTRVDH